VVVRDPGLTPKKKKNGGLDDLEALRNRVECRGVCPRWNFLLSVINNDRARSIRYQLRNRYIPSHSLCLKLMEQQVYISPSPSLPWTRVRHLLSPWSQ
jgi:hypothetical protein